MNKKSSKFHVDESDLLCKNRCGYYGNTAWKGYCSVCYKSISGRQRSQSHQASHNLSRNVKSSRSNTRSERNFAKLEEKRPQQSDRITGTVKSLFSKSSRKERSEVDRLGSSQAGTLSDPNRLNSKRNNEFSTFLNNLSMPIYDDISKRVHSFLVKFKTLPQSSAVESWSDAVQDFYQVINDHINTDHKFQGLEETVINELLDHLEIYLMNRLYNAVFCPANSDDEQQDLHLQKRIRDLHWVTIQQLEATVDDQDLGVRSALDKSISDIIELDTKKSPKDKLTCIVDCSRKIFDALRLSSLKAVEASGGSASAASADDFLPVFIFIILKANPPRLKSNINYITRFSCPSRLNSGEGGYFFTNMCCVVDFIEKLNAESLNLSEEEFSKYMLGEAVPEGVSTLYMCDGLRLIHENSEMLKKLKERQERCQSNVHELEQRLAEFRIEFDDQINTLVENTPLILKPRRRKADLDVDADVPPTLPSPIVPQQLAS